MNKALIGALVGGLILWIWQFVSWGMINLHGAEMQYTDSQDTILECLEAAGLQEGSYYMPRLGDDASEEAREAFMAERMGKPWALITYNEEMEFSFGMNLVRALIVDLLAVYFLCYILIGRVDLDFKKVLIASVMVGLIGYFTFPYLDTIWFETNSIAHLIDTVVQWGLVGAWLGYWLNRGEAA